MAKGLEQLKVIRERLKNARLDDTSSEFNTQRVECGTGSGVQRLFLPNRAAGMQHNFPVS